MRFSYVATLIARGFILTCLKNKFGTGWRCRLPLLKAYILLLAEHIKPFLSWVVVNAVFKMFPDSLWIDLHQILLDNIRQSKLYRNFVPDF